MVGLAEQKAGSHIARYGRKIGTVIAIEHLFGTGSPNHGYQAVVMVRVATIEPIGNAVDLFLGDDIGIIDVGIVDGDAEVEDSVDASPVAQSDGYTIGVLTIEAVNVFAILLDIRSETLSIGFVFHGYGVKCCL